ncbi:MAG: hypothetical protein GYB19_10120 [Rhodospirillales bacterium]|nr:hypothetical protein [Rhodospirillales bacterium]
MSKSINRKRREAYPSVGEQLAAVFKYFHQQREAGATLPPDTDRVLNEILAVKRDHPKPDKEQGNGKA